MVDFQGYAEAVRHRVAEKGVGLHEAILAELDTGYETGEVDLNAEGDLARSIERQLLGFGAIDDLLIDSTVEELWINPDGQIFYSRAGIRVRHEQEIEAESCADLVEKLLRQTSRRIDRATPFVDATLPDGSRLHIIGYGLTDRSFSVNIRKFGRSFFSIESLIGREMLTVSQAHMLVEALNRRESIIIAGGTNSGKTTLLCALLSTLGSSERIISIEDTRELRISATDWVALQTRPENLEGSGEIGMRRLVRESLRMRPDRLVIGEVRGAEAFDLLMALNSGVPGMATLHANSSSAAIGKLHSLPLLAGANVSETFIRNSIESCINLVVYCELTRSGVRKITEIQAIDEVVRWPAQ